AHAFHSESVARKGVGLGFLHKFFQDLPAGFLLVCHDGYRSIRMERALPKFRHAGTNEAREKQNDKLDTRFEVEAEAGERFAVRDGGSSAAGANEPAGKTFGGASNA